MFKLYQQYNAHIYVYIDFSLEQIQINIVLNDCAIVHNDNNIRSRQIKLIAIIFIKIYIYIYILCFYTRVLKENNNNNKKKMYKN